MSLVAAVVPWRKLCLSSRNPSRGSVSVATTSLLMQAPLTAPPKSRLSSLSKNALEPLLAKNDCVGLSRFQRNRLRANRRLSARLRFPFDELVKNTDMPLLCDIEIMSNSKNFRFLLKLRQLITIVFDTFKKYK